MYVHQSIARSVMEHGVGTMFGLMGDANLFMVDDYVRSQGGRFVPVAIEGSAVLAAMAYTQIAGRGDGTKVGVSTVTHGPGLTNCVTPLTEGARRRCPSILLTGDTPTLERDALQDIDQRELVKATGAGFEQIRAPETAANDVAHAFYRARMEKRPIVVNMPADFMWAEVEHTPVKYRAFKAPSYVPEGDDFDEALGLIASARRPIILAGAGAITAKDRLIALAERMEAPLATTLKAKNLFLGHRYNMDIFGTLSTPDAYEVIAAADCIVSFGSSLHHFTTDQGALMRHKRVVQISDDSSDVDQTYRPDAALVADPGLTADNIVYWLDEAQVEPTGFVNQLDPASLAAHPPGDPGRDTDETVGFAYVLDRLDEALPSDRILITDGGRFMTEVWCRVAASDPMSFISGVDFGSIGLGMAQAIGAGHAAPGRPVCLFTGDGGFMMGGLTEFNTAVRTGIDLIVIVCNDSAYGAEHVQLTDRNMDPTLTEFDWPSFAATATALGGHGVTVTCDEDLPAAFAAIENRARPLLIDIHLDPHSVPRMRR